MLQNYKNKQNGNRDGKQRGSKLEAGWKVG
jgi:hypothetical protein